MEINRTAVSKFVAHDERHRCKLNSSGPKVGFSALFFDVTDTTVSCFPHSFFLPFAVQAHLFVRSSMRLVD